ncbi:MAG: hypothetical protein UU81_C0046G0010 [Microgenomates group bacterium GW2011_GWC1_41_8]|uniref:Uncharacterized protein n=2 Tax=Candidatus Roizmaniibacteriota TaxID=1752723 RepID=A0A0G0VIV1_9BACT|nr:MAG: hypothetical protein UU14_C0016G0030 [Candidatus Roizmanbacteria bacterium GW2011_GWB1_40_7]KKR93937.1 MAG: hypothetical protein UU41_C0017G0030 [Candidatus Roizmanbacteria bacterium GW2011_GWA1_41_13]KKS22909.1 MAG: hypothetical protein UU81_C0046G0010 [Microgenomates group bacterium GW2011_GWC1_41_8]
MKLLRGQSPSFPLSQLLDTNLSNDSIYFRHNREFTMDELKEILRTSKFVLRNMLVFTLPSAKEKSLMQPQRSDTQSPNSTRRSWILC